MQTREKKSTMLGKMALTAATTILLGSPLGCEMDPSLSLGDADDERIAQKNQAYAMYETNYCFKKSSGQHARWKSVYESGAQYAMVNSSYSCDNPDTRMQFEHENSEGGEPVELGDFVTIRHEDGLLQESQNTGKFWFNPNASNTFQICKYGATGCCAPDCGSTIKVDTNHDEFYLRIAGKSPMHVIRKVEHRLRQSTTLDDDAMWVLEPN